MIAVDTSVLVYAYDVSSPAKQSAAKALLTGLTDGVLLWQVAVEFVAACRKPLAEGEDPMSVWDRLDEIRGLLSPVMPEPGVLAAARRIQLHTRAQF